MGMFVALLEYTEDEELRLRTRPAHREYLRTLLEAGRLVMSGPWADGTGAMLIYDVEDQAEAQRLLTDDPFRQAGVLADARIREWHVVLRAPYTA